MTFRLGLAVHSLLFASLVMAQSPGTTDAEGNYYWPNGQGRYPLQRKGKWEVNPLVQHEPARTPVAAATAAERQSVAATLEAVSTLLRSTPEADRLLGYWMRVPRRFYYSQAIDLPPSVPAARMPLTFEAGFFPFALEDILKKGQYVPQWGGETTPSYYWFNRLPGSQGRQTIFTEEQSNEFKLETYLRPRVTADFHGFPLIEGKAVLIARPGRDPWAPVSHARALKLAVPLIEKDVATAEKRLADLKKKNEETQSPEYEAQMRAHLEKYSGEFKTTNPKKWEGRVAGMQQELKYNREKAARDANPQRDKDGMWYWAPVDALADAKKRVGALTPADDSAPSCYLELKGDSAQGRYALRGDIQRAGANPACEPLVNDNYAYFDLKAPRSEPQILYIDRVGSCMKYVNGQFVRTWNLVPGKMAHGCAFHPFYWEQMDWTKLAALIRR